ncbi:hypothetical protein E4U38_000718 [Claviceps purpurea]|nr:hypothetical protein E4U38_000718 [Claviceps purpurea]
MTSQSDLEAKFIGFPITPCSIWIVNPHDIHHLAPRRPSGQTLQQVYDGYEEVVESHIAALRQVADTKLPAVALPDLDWIVVEKLPRIDHQELDRQRIRQWLKGYLLCSLCVHSGILGVCMITTFLGTREDGNTPQLSGCRSD